MSTDISRLWMAMGVRLASAGLAVALTACGGESINSASDQPKLLATTSNWTSCANENGQCAFSGAQTVRYGAGSSFATKTLIGGTPCNNTVFGDAAPGLAKHCDITPPSWSFCSNENTQCTFSGSRAVRYGAGSKFITKILSGGTACNNAVFGDPAAGATKHCDLAPASTAPNQILLGMFPGLADVNAINAWLGKKMSVQTMFTNWDTRDTVGAFATLKNIWDSGSVPILTWQVFIDSHAATSPANIDALIAGGSYDAYVNDYANRLKTFLSGPDGIYGNGDDRRVYLRFAHEMNGNWYPWSAGTPGYTNTPTDFINMWRRVHGLVSAKGLDANHLQWIWSPMNCDCTQYRLEQYFPGTAYVDWVGFDAYNWGNAASWSAWTSPTVLIDPWISRVAVYGKPIAIPEIGTTSNYLGASNVGVKAQWLTDMFTYVSNKGASDTTARVKLASYFNIDKETDWAVFGGTQGIGNQSFSYGGKSYKAYSNFQQSAASGMYIAGSTSNARRISDAQFQGK